MYALDFEFDNRRLSDYGFIICDFNYPSGADVVSAGSEIVFETVSMNKGNHFPLVDSKYDENLQTTFDICKNPDEYDDLEITDEEFLKLSRWLVRQKFFDIRFYDDDIDRKTRYYHGSFNVSKIKIRERLCGLELTMVTDKPFAYGDQQTFFHEFTGPSDFSYIYDASDVTCSFVPDMKITCLESGNLLIKNDLFDTTMQIKNCTAGEVITIHGQPQIILSSNGEHDIWDDFNYEFLKIGNTFWNRHNKLTSTLRCVLEITYSPILKDSP